MRNGDFMKKIYLAKMYKAFTLAEILVVILIIGIVAALTLPQLADVSTDKETVSKVQKNYAAITDAFGRAEANYGSITEWFSGMDQDIPGASQKFGERLLEYMKVSQVCGQESGCIADAPLLNPPGEFLIPSFLGYLQSTGAYMAKLADGTSIAFRFEGQVCRIGIDIDGPTTGENQQGVDVFEFSIGLDSGSSVYRYREVLPSAGGLNWTGNRVSEYATAWVIMNGNLDYLNCGGLNWETKISCK